jgi:hypothetical protein
MTNYDQKYKPNNLLEHTYSLTLSNATLNPL